jgi:hypothetical protein
MSIVYITFKWLNGEKTTCAVFKNKYVAGGIRFCTVRGPDYIIAKDKIESMHYADRRLVSDAVRFELEVKVDECVARWPSGLPA